MPTHCEHRGLPFAPEQLFDLVADVERYPEFLPWCLNARVYARQEASFLADLTVGTRFLRDTFTSHVTLEQPRRIVVAYRSGPLKALGNEWHFEPGPQGGCLLTFEVDFHLASRGLGLVMDVVFDHACRTMGAAFEARAHALYGET